MCKLQQSFRALHSKQQSSSLPIDLLVVQSCLTISVLLTLRRTMLDIVKNTTQIAGEVWDRQLWVAREYCLLTVSLHNLSLYTNCTSGHGLSYMTCYTEKNTGVQRALLRMSLIAVRFACIDFVPIREGVGLSVICKMVEGDMKSQRAE